MMTTRFAAIGLAALLAATAPALMPHVAHAEEMIDVLAYFDGVAAVEGVGSARKAKPVDARPAVPGEIVVTVIRGEGKETESPPAAAGDMVVRNRCPETGNEEILVTAAKFAERYDGPIGEDTGGWRPYRPRGVDMRFVIVRPSDGAFSFIAPWGEAMVARPGDAIVQDPRNPSDTYRIARAAFACTYEVTAEPGGG
jgi:hypothetical protein